jgi:hypothetical protein
MRYSDWKSFGGLQYPAKYEILDEAGATGTQHASIPRNTAFPEHDANALSGIYGEDADWTNPFGTTRHRT